MINKPQKIYLNLGFNKNINIEDFNDLRISEITWSRHRIFDTDLEYIYTGPKEEIKWQNKKPKQ